MTATTKAAEIPAGSKILATLSSLADEQVTIKTTGPISWNESLQRFYVNGYKLIRSRTEFSKTERRWCLISFEKIWRDPFTAEEQAEFDRELCHVCGLRFDAHDGREEHRFEGR